MRKREQRAAITLARALYLDIYARAEAAASGCWLTEQHHHHPDALCTASNQPCQCKLSLDKKRARNEY